MTDRYKGVFENRFLQNQRRYSSLRKHIQAHVDQILEDPYRDSEKLGRQPKGKDLRGCRSVRVTHSFRILFVICEECRRVAECQYCFCEGLSDRTIVFLTVGPHERACAMREKPGQYAAEHETPHPTDA